MDSELERDFGNFVAARGQALFRTAMALTGHRQEAEDLLQTALASTVRHWHRVRHGSPEGYLRTALIRQYTSWWRRARRRPEVVTSDPPDRPTGDGGGARVDTSLVVRAALARLTPRQRTVLVLRYFEDLPDAAIAEVMGCGESTVRSQALRALRRLRESAPELAAMQPDHAPEPGRHPAPTRVPARGETTT